MPSLTPTRRYVRDPSVAALSRQDSVVFCKPNGDVVLVEPVDVAWLSGVLGRAALPLSGRELLLGATPKQVKTLNELFAEEILQEARPQGRAPQRGPGRQKKPCRHLVLGVTGAIQAVHTSALVLPLLYRFCERLDLVLTQASTHFVAPEAFAYFGVGVWTDAHRSSREAAVPHVQLAQSAELVLVAPASAHALQRFASGACSDLLSLVVAATSAPVVVAPSMNSAMWRKPAIARNVARLRADGFFVVEPTVGFEASAGPRPEPELGGMGLPQESLLAALASVLELSRR